MTGVRFMMIANRANLSLLDDGFKSLTSELESKGRTRSRDASRLEPISTEIGRYKQSVAVPK